MNTSQADYVVIPFPKLRRGAIDLLRKGRRMHIIHGLIEVDVTQPRRYLRDHKTRTGESLSFTAFIATCLARAVDENKLMHAYRNGRNQLVLFHAEPVIQQGIRKRVSKHATAKSCGRSNATCSRKDCIAGVGFQPCVGHPTMSMSTPWISAGCAGSTRTAPYLSPCTQRVGDSLGDAFGVPLLRIVDN